MVSKHSKLMQHNLRKALDLTLSTASTLPEVDGKIIKGLTIWILFFEVLRHWCWQNDGISFFSRLMIRWPCSYSMINGSCMKLLSFSFFPQFLASAWDQTPHKTWLWRVTLIWLDGSLPPFASQEDLSGASNALKLLTVMGRRCSNIRYIHSQTRKTCTHPLWGRSVEHGADLLLYGVHRKGSEAPTRVSWRQCEVVVVSMSNALKRRLPNQMCRRE